ncbi:hypothetical protein [Actinacidiphila acididurans]|uniref:Uncharacterized protein n=1 Tax=Actinacidiphila acididurans TaxID=2784346 RepID=A0ABS2U4P8_9ACTN|nr:hypothetical protein [Actinacidiphila acididurans]MBM9510136.1 hypothetical protein [Actinacidiphila acididurans]
MSGSGTTVDFETVTPAKSGNTITGYVYASDGSNNYFQWSGHESKATGVKLTVNRAFTNNSLFCGGVASAPVDASYPDSVCFTIHS